MTIRCNLCPDVSPFIVPCGDGIGEALMAAHMQDEHGVSGPARKLAAGRPVPTRRFTDNG
jgi:hypothetical protein